MRHSSYQTPPVTSVRNWPWEALSLMKLLSERRQAAGLQSELSQKQCNRNQEDMSLPTSSFRDPIRLISVVTLGEPVRPNQLSSAKIVTCFAIVNARVWDKFDSVNSYSSNSA